MSKKTINLGEAFDLYAQFNDHLGLITGANTMISKDMFNGDYVVSGRISTLSAGSETTELYRGKDRKKAIWVANEVISAMKQNIALLEKEKKETFQYEY